MSLMIEFAPQIIKEAEWFTRQVKARQLRTMAQFAEQEIILPNGPYADESYDLSVQTHSRHWFAEVDSHRWMFHAAVGVTQSGKTLDCFVIPIMYYIFEVEEDVICGLPSQLMSGSKWLKDIKPVIDKSRYRNQLPTTGQGSKDGGNPTDIRFKNGKHLSFRSGGGGDKSRAGDTARILVITEVDGMDEASAASRETDKIGQLVARTRAFPRDKVVFLECTASITAGRIWQEYIGGTKSEIRLLCPKCKEYVYPGRESLVGWKDCADVLEAIEKAHFVCPLCAEPWTEDDRLSACNHSLLVHDGQSIEGGKVVGDPPRTRTLGFRWAAVHNLFSEAGDIGADEWKAEHVEEDPDNAKKEIHQFVHALPYDPDVIDMTHLKAYTVKDRKADFEQGRVPADTESLTVAIDIGKWKCHWAVIAWRPGASPHVLNYGIEVPESNRLAVEEAIMATLLEFRDAVEFGWPSQTGELIIPSVGFVDSGDWTDMVYEFCHQSKSTTGTRWLPFKGFGYSQQDFGVYRAPRSKTATIRVIGDEYHIVKLRVDSKRIELVQANADRWKSFMHEALSTPMGEAGAMTLFASGEANEHLTFARHLTAEKAVQEFVEKKGYVEKWVQSGRQNHWGDAVYMNCVAGHIDGVRLPAKSGKGSDGAGKSKPAAVAAGSWFDKQRRR